MPLLLLLPFSLAEQQRQQLPPRRAIIAKINLKLPAERRLLPRSPKACNARVTNGPLHRRGESGTTELVDLFLFTVIR